MAFLNLGNHEFMAEQIASKKSSNPTSTCVKSEENSGTAKTFVKLVANYPSLDACLNLRWPSAESEILPKHVPKGYFVMQVLRRCPSNTSPLTLQRLKSVWKDVAGDLSVDESLLTDEDFLCCCGSSSPSVNAILGGVVSQEIVRAITGKGAPHGNWYFLNGLQCTTTVEWLPNSATSP
ncbi:Ubiquitin 1-activating enzyme E1 A [Paragonimus skrjabini miyazakii]|uniref:Ubiquitin 1-activating enzyme E1 A n=1 Tax=Paragonimus skrjabini miyazakii TaxID=59628 RepID=A0A8S9YU81_9TREM|nr:Ubiquitin 1-activating enzyme E1 A [Paragonimus skrjabini miyazakii]